MFDEIGRAHQVVEQSAFNGKSLRWKLIQQLSKEPVVVKIEPGTTDISIPFVSITTNNTKKNVRKAPATKAKEVSVGETVMGQDGKTMFKCVERTRKSDGGGITYKVWQKMAAK